MQWEPNKEARLPSLVLKRRPSVSPVRGSVASSRGSVSSKRRLPAPPFGPKCGLGSGTPDDPLSSEAQGIHGCARVPTLQLGQKIPSLGPCLLDRHKIPISSNPSATRFLSTLFPNLISSSLCHLQFCILSKAKSVPSLCAMPLCRSLRRAYSVGL